MSSTGDLRRPADIRTSKPMKEAAETYYRRLAGLQAAASVFHGTSEPEEVTSWAHEYERYLETGIVVATP